MKKAIRENLSKEGMWHMEKAIYLVGQNNLQNQLLQLFLGKEIGIECRLGEDLTLVPPVPESGTEGFSLVLWDCISKSIQLLKRELENGFLLLHPGCCVALYNYGPDVGIPRSMLGKNIRGIFFEKDPPEMIAKGIRKIEEGELWLPRKTMSRLVLEKPSMDVPASLKAQLTGRERQILGFLAAGKSNREIADNLYVSPHTVKTHVYNIFQKIEVSNRLQAALWAGKHL